LKLKAAIIGATGAVGQRYLSLLEKHPLIEVEVLMGLSSAGKKYSEATNWILATQLPEKFSEMKVMETSPKNAKGCDIVFSALPSEAALKIEEDFASSGYFVISESSAHRMDEDVPLVIPEVNHEHFELLRVQKKKRGWKGSLVTTPNCTVTGLAIALKPIDERFAVEDAIVTTMQALSGAGFPGVSSLSIVDNVIPYIKDEEKKVEVETRKILGKISSKQIVEKKIRIAASCNRVSVLDGHMESVFLRTGKEIDEKQAERELSNFSSLPQKLRLPFAPLHPIIVRKEPDRPQPRIDRMSGSVPGMSVVVGRIRKGLDKNWLQFTLLSHNTVRGAAGNAILTAELAEKLGYVGA
jgi:aspartate-semialdehyde dehydrogenase